MQRNSHVVIAVSLLFSASSLLFATSLQPAPMAVVITGTIGVNLLLWRGLERGELLTRKLDFPWLAACLALGLALALLGGEGHLVFAKDDWLTRDSLLADLARYGATARYETEAGVALTRAPLGMYLLPAAIGRLFGLGAAHIALAAQTTLILGGFFYCVTLVWPKRRGLFVALFVLFAGLDVLPVLTKTGGEWLPRYLAFWVDRMYYPANLSQLFWSPNHLLPGWWFAALAALYLRRELDLAALAAASAPLVMWSPLTTAGAAALFAFFVLRAPRELLTRRFALTCVAALGFTPILVYLSVAAGDAPHGWQFTNKDFRSDYPIFVLFSLTQALLLAALWRKVEPWFRGALLASIALLLVIPAYSVGFMSDFTQRASIAPHAMLAFGFDALLIELLNGGGLALTAGGLIVLVGAATPALELWDSLTTPRWSISDCNQMTVNIRYWGRSFVSTYLAPETAFPSWLLLATETLPPLKPEERTCWPDRVFGEHKFNYMKPEYRIWLKKSPESAQR